MISFVLSLPISDNRVSAVAVVAVGNKDMALEHKLWFKANRRRAISRFDMEDRSPVLLCTDGGMWRLRSLPIAAGTIFWSPPVVDVDDDDNRGPVEWLLLDMIPAGSTRTCVGTCPLIGSTVREKGSYLVKKDGVNPMTYLMVMIDHHHLTLMLVYWSSHRQSYLH